MFHACIHISILGVCDVEVEEKLAQVNSTMVADLEVYLFNPSSILYFCSTQFSQNVTVTFHTQTAFKKTTHKTRKMVSDVKFNRYLSARDF